MPRRVIVKFINFSWILLACSLTAAPILSQDKAPQEKPAAEKAAPQTSFKGTLLSSVPADTTLLIRVPSAKAFVEKAKSSPLGQLQNHPDVKKLLDDLKQKAGPELEKAEKELGFHPIDTLLSIDGEWVLAIGNLTAFASALGESLQMGQMPQSLSPETIPLIIAADAGASAGKVHDSFEKLFSFAEKNGAKREAADFNGGKITRLSEPGPQKPAGKPDEKKGVEPEKVEKPKKEKSDLIARPEGDEDDKDSAKKADDSDDSDDDDKEEAPKSQPMNVYFGELGGRFYLSLNRQLLEGCMQKADAERADGIVKNALFQETHAATGSGDVFLFVNTKQLTSSVGNALSATFFAFFWQKFEAIFLGTSLNNFAMSYSIDKDSLSQTAFVNNAGASDGFLGIFKGETFAPTSVPPVPSDSQNFSSISFNPVQLSKIVKDTVQLIMSFQGQSADIDALVEGQVGVKFSEVMAGLGKRFHTFTGALKADNPLASVNYVLELKDESPLKKVLKKVSEIAQGQFDAEKFKDRDIYSFDTGSFGMNVTAADKLLILSGNRSAVEKVLNRVGDATAVAPGGEAFKKAAATMPAQVAMVAYSSPEYAKSMVKSITDQMGSNLDPEVEPFLKAFSALAEAFGSASGFGVWKDKGFFAQSKTDYAKK